MYYSIHFSLTHSNFSLIWRVVLWVSLAEASEKRRAQLLSTCNTDSRLERCKQLPGKFPEHIWSLSSGLLMRSCLQWRPQSTIVSTYPQQHWSATLTPMAYCGPARLSAAHRWSPSPFRSSGARNCSWWNMGWRSTANITRMSCWWRRCCQRSGGWISGDFFIYQLDSAPAHRAKDTIALMRRETPSFIGPANSPDLNPVDYRIWGLIQERVYQTAIRNIDELNERLRVVWEELKQIECHWQRYWTVAAKAESLRPSEGTCIASNILLNETLHFLF